MTKAKCCDENTNRFNQIDSSADLLKIISEPNRIKILCILNSAEICVCDLAEKIELPQNLVSHHLKVMQEGGLLGKVRRGNQLFYYIKTSMKAKITKLFEFIDIN